MLLRAVLPVSGYRICAPIWTPRRPGDKRVGDGRPKAEGWGPEGLWNAQERLAAFEARRILSLHIPGLELR